MDAIYTEKYKGLTIEIIPDSDPRRPDEDGDNSLFLLGFHRDFFVENKSFPQLKSGEVIRAILENDRQDMIYNGVEDIKKQFHVLPLAAYIHSGVSLSLARTGQYADRFASCTVGAVFLDKKEFKSIKQARKIAAGYVEEWNNYLNGEVYGYTVEPGGASCWGFSGDWQKSGILEEARAEADAIIKAEAEAHSKKLKGYIKNGVPLDFRKPLNVAAGA